MKKSRNLDTVLLKSLPTSIYLVKGSTCHLLKFRYCSGRLRALDYFCNSRGDHFDLHVVKHTPLSSIMPVTRCDMDCPMKNAIGPSKAEESINMGIKINYPSAYVRSVSRHSDRLFQRALSAASSSPSKVVRSSKQKATSSKSTLRRSVRRGNGSREGRQRSKI